MGRPSEGDASRLRLTALYMENEKYEGINKGKIDRIVCESGRYEGKNKGLKNEEAK